MIKQICFLVFAALFYIVYLPCAIIKSLVNTLYIPFDTQRFANTFVAFCRNANILWESVLYQEQESQESGQEDSDEKSHIGFTVYPSNAPGLPTAPDEI